MTPEELDSTTQREIITRYYMRQSAAIKREYGFSDDDIAACLETFEREVKEIHKLGLSLRQMAIRTGYSSYLIRKKLIELGLYTIQRREKIDKFLIEPPADALVHVSDPSNGYAGFDLLPDEALRLVNIRIIKRCCGTDGKERDRYSSAYMQPIDPNKIIQPKQP